MKWILKIFVILLMLQSFQCSDSEEKTNAITPKQLEQKKQEIVNYINSFTCSETIGCNYIAFGSKPCGGPRIYLVFPNSIDLKLLKDMVTKYNEMDRLYNIQIGAVSDCAVVLPPNEIKCVNGICTIVN